MHRRHFLNDASQTMYTLRYIPHMLSVSVIATLMLSVRPSVTLKYHSHTVRFPSQTGLITRVIRLSIYYAQAAYKNTL